MKVESLPIPKPPPQDKDGKFTDKGEDSESATLPREVQTKK